MGCAVLSYLKSKNTAKVAPQATIIGKDDNDDVIFVGTGPRARDGPAELIANPRVDQLTIVPAARSRRGDRPRESSAAKANTGAASTATELLQVPNTPQPQ
ncbi:hypothetical protein PTSG_00296 [Salpingoeca rosetta]|uniref:Uncharacterized protein n=1 Tax=Salpingoeca rosetta (strain ATCC 50818 / BSB-021) TaxID=946362 RepID=F2TW30_SALR5|nr:uncharacterized protein PTSG_00296 [Salpingoeca rosetta]EGD72276.1 hypothetical protein PTSG_00296 [Salpingoeca rosetta]|eukprot:XP_004998846.1 hypothetical protein PTSG_00296 [Salpingoeca rosetta]